MNLVLLFPGDFTDPTHVTLTDYRAEHIREIHRASVGKTLKMGLVNSGVGEGTITHIQGSAITIEVRIPDVRPETPRVSLILALPRPQTLKKVLETAGAFGLRKVVLVATERVQKSFFSSKLLKDKSWMKHLRLGMEQGGRTYLPEISVEPSLKPCFQNLHDHFPGAVRLIAHPGQEASLWETPLALEGSRNVVCAVGPEGGWVDQEVALFRDAGFQSIRLGDTVHRVENAVTALLAQIELFGMKGR